MIGGPSVTKGKKKKWKETPHLIMVEKGKRAACLGLAKRVP